MIQKNTRDALEQNFKNVNNIDIQKCSSARFEVCLGALSKRIRVLAGNSFA
jgi:hypothetical protein